MSPDANETRGQREAPIELRLEGVGKRFGDRVVLRGVDLTIRAGEIVAIVGGSGSGKTVLMDMMIGLLAPSEGRVLVADRRGGQGGGQGDGQGGGQGGVEGCVEGGEEDGGGRLVDLAELESTELDALRLRWSVVFQHNALFSGTVEENVALWFREHTSLPASEIERRVRESLEAVELDVQDVLKKDRSELSGGMAKRVAIARAIATEPRVMFYDEPTTGLDPLHAARIHELIFETHHAEDDRTTLIVTHDKELLRRVRPRVVMLHQGGVCFDGPYEDFGNTDCEPASEYLRAMPVLHAKPTGS